MTFNTGNPIGSTDARDRSDNSEFLDEAVNSLDLTKVDRLGRTRDTLEGIYQKSAYYRAGTFDAGYTLTNNRQTLAYGNIEYSWSGSFPKVVSAGSTPATSGGIGAGAWVDRTQDTLRADIANEGIGTRLVGWVNPLINSVVGNVYRWLSGRQVSVFDFMTEAQQADVQSFTGEIDVTEAVRNALLASRTVHMPQGRYKIVGNINLTKRHKLFGDGSDKTILDYHGTDADAILAGTLTPEDYQKYIELSGFTVVIKDKTAAHNAVALENAVRFKLRDIWCVGAGNPNAQEVLTGNGIHIRNGSFIGSVSGCYTELFNYGLYEQNHDTNQNLWTAAIVYDQQCEFTNNNIGMVFGSTTNSLLTSQGCTVRDVTVEFNYRGGILVNNAYKLGLHNIYAEANGNFDIQVGNPYALAAPVCVSVKDCCMPSADIPSPYGSTPYHAKVSVPKAVFTEIVGNNISNPSGGLCIDIGATSDRASVHENRVNTTTGTSISDSGNDTLRYRNFGDEPFPFVGPSYLNGWVAASGYQTPRYFIEQDLQGKKWVVLEGAVSSGADGTTMFMLPTGYRPTNGRVDFAVGQMASGVCNGVAVLMDGSVVCSNKNTLTVFLSGIRFCIS